MSASVRTSIHVEVVPERTSDQAPFHATVGGMAQRVNENGASTTCDVERGLPVAERSATKLLVWRLSDVPDEVNEIARRRNLIRSRRTPESVRAEIGEVQDSERALSSAANGRAGGGSTRSSARQNCASCGASVRRAISTVIRGTLSLCVPAILDGLADEHLGGLDVWPAQLIHDPFGC